jgi:hypothetical protein
VAILEEEVEISLHGKNIGYFEKLGYEIPRRKDEHGRIRVELGAKITVKIDHLAKTSSALVTKICDDCGCTVENTPYKSIALSRRRRDGRDRCMDCAWKYGASINVSRYLAKGNSVVDSDPQFASLFYYEEEAHKYSVHSKKRAYFRCPSCDSKLLKTVSVVRQKGLYCDFCDDGLKIPEKFTVALLKQLDVNFEREKIFEWSDKKRYDFYIVDKNMIIETHGEQHYGTGFEHRGGRSLEEEQANDKLKYDNAMKNGIENYIVIDCRVSELEYLKNSFLNSELVNFYDLTYLDWEACYESACRQLTHVAWRLWNDGIKQLSEIAKIINVNQEVVRRFLKQGVSVGKCDYDVEKERSASPVVQLSLTGEFIKEHELITKAIEELGITSKNGYVNISGVCRGQHQSAFGFRWMYKEEYDKYLNGEIELPPMLDNRFTIIVQLTKDGEYIAEHAGILEASKSIGLSRSNSQIIACCKNKWGVAHGFRWMYKEVYIKYLNGEIKLSPLPAKGKRVSGEQSSAKAVVQLDRYTLHFIAEYATATDGANAIGESNGRPNITNCCKRKRESAYGFIWLYKEDYERFLNGEIELSPFPENATIHSVAVRKKISLSKMGKMTSGENPRARAIVQLDTKTLGFIAEYPTATDGANAIAGGKGRANITSCCKGERKWAYGFKWMYKDDYLKYKNGMMDLLPLQKATGEFPTDKVIVQLDMNTISVIAEYPTATVAANAIAGGKGRPNITNCCKGEKKSAYGYKWMYKEDYEEKYGKSKRAINN